MDLIKINTFYTYEDEFIFITRKTKKCIGYIKGILSFDVVTHKPIIGFNCVDTMEFDILNKFIMDEYGFYLKHKCKETNKITKIYILGQSYNCESWVINNDLDKYKTLFK